MSTRSGRAGLVWDVKNEEPGLAGSVERLQAWYADLDAELEAALTAIPEDEFRTGKIDRGEGFMMPIGSQFHTYREAILIFCAKADVYLRCHGQAPRRTVGGLDRLTRAVRSHGMRNARPTGSSGGRHSERGYWPITPPWRRRRTTSWPTPWPLVSPAAASPAK